MTHEYVKNWSFYAPFHDFLANASFSIFSHDFLKYLYWLCKKREIPVIITVTIYGKNTFN